ncbi:MAG: hypothetical protein V1736_05645 [Pseudomonadota bacterium]
MLKPSLMRFVRILIGALICAHLAVFGFYVYRNGFKKLHFGHTQAVAEDSLKAQPRFSLEDLKSFEIIETKRRDLAAKEEELRDKEQELTVLKKDIEEKLDRLSQLQEQIQKNLETMKQKDDARLKHVVGAYSAMKPVKAAGLIEKLDDEVALRILSSMKSKDVGSILSFVNTEKAAKLSQRLAK